MSGVSQHPGDGPDEVPLRAVVWEARLDRGLRRGGIAISLVLLVESLATISRLPIGGVGAVAVATGLAAYALALGHALGRPRLLGTAGGEALLPYSALALTTVASLLAARAWPEPAQGTFLTSLAAMVGIHALLVLGPRRSIVPLAVTFVAAAFADGAFSDVPMIAVRSRGEMFAYAVFVAIAYLLGRALALSARETHRALDTARLAVDERRGAERAGIAGREVERFIHDEVLHHLRALRLGAAGGGEEGLRRDSAHLAERLRRGGQVLAPLQARAGLVDLSAALHAIVARSPLLVRLQTPGQVLVPYDVARDLVLGLREGLRNVERHSGTNAATLTVRGTGERVVVVLGDEGVGFDPQQVPTERFGLARSLVERIEGIGGTVQVDSAPGQGTTLTIDWAPGESSRDAVPRVRDQVARAFAAAVVPGFVGLIPSAAYQASELADPATALAASLVLVLAAAVCVPRGLRRGLDAVGGQVLLWLAALASLTNGLALRDPADVPEYWASGGAAGFAYFVILLRPVRETVLPAVVIALLPVVVVLPQLHDVDDVLRLAPVLTTPTIAVVCGYLVRRLVGSFGSAVATAIEAESRAAAATVAAESDLEEAAARLADLEARATPVLDEVAAGGLDLDDPTTRTRIAELEAGLRADLELARTPALRDALRRLPTGWTVRTRVVADLPPGADRILADGVLGLASTGGPPATLDVSARGFADEVELSLVLRPGTEDRAAALPDWDGAVLGPLIRLTRSVPHGRLDP